VIREPDYDRASPARTAAGAGGRSPVALPPGERPCLAHVDEWDWWLHSSAALARIRADLARLGELDEAVARLPVRKRSRAARPPVWDEVVHRRVGPDCRYAVRLLRRGADWYWRSATVRHSRGPHPTRDAALADARVTAGRALARRKARAG
jgi:hypothetical protein